MRVIKLVVCALIVAATPALAADEFGSMFSSNTPDALQDPSQSGDDELQNLLNIEPAAGEEDSTMEPAVIPEAPMLQEDPAMEMLQNEVQNSEMQTSPVTNISAE